ncbi:dipeptidase [Undibacterium cyanobacteriorum]|uniref:Dipeptidase n=1 Tax=Undibacterium cyanobacteriorum TaxID=3073561 RepID=A0ABY9RJC6_9BURK|nr:dipeptidase [Undibacterium sp. 20NA77.5]WMW81302.1 dipeptidase [Undibacterium sp. 20NA77.5]
MNRLALLPLSLALSLAGFNYAIATPNQQAVAKSAAPKQLSEEQLIAKAKGIHQRVITLDTHNDIDVGNFGFSRNYSQELENQVNLPKMIKGGLDASFFIVYTNQATDAEAFTAAGYKKAYDTAINSFEAIHRMTTVLAPNLIEFARTADDVRKINAKGKKVALIGVENAYPLGDEKTAVKRVKEFYDRGARYMSLAHQGHSQLSDSNTGEAIGWKWNGLSPLGKQVIAEMNRVGIMIDISHPSKESMMQSLQITKAPIIASHSAVRALADVSRNLDDEQLLALKANNGVAQIVAFNTYVKTDSTERRAAFAALRKEFNLGETVSLTGIRRGTPNGMSEETREQILKRLTEIDAQLPAPTRATVKDFVNHIDYAVKKIGIDHVGISSDFDGGGGIDGWNDASETFNVTLELVRRGYTEAQIAKLWSGNLLRVMADVEKVAKELQSKK